jgi:hypothetical protein
VTGATGVTGAAGISPVGPLLVKDANGTVLGNYLYYFPGASPPTGNYGYTGDYVFIRAQGLSFSIPFETVRLGTNTSLDAAGPANGGTTVLNNGVFFTGPDCTGTPYFRMGLTQPYPLAVNTAASVIGTVVYIIGGAPNQFNSQSNSEQIRPSYVVGSTCSNSNYPVNGWPLVGIFDLSTLNVTPPFSVQ